jgi:sortase (surface protein transpeptidase)
MTIFEILLKPLPIIRFIDEKNCWTKKKKAENFKESQQKRKSKESQQNNERKKQQKMKESKSKVPEAVKKILEKN